MNDQLTSDGNHTKQILGRVLEMAEKHFKGQNDLAPGLHIPDIAMDELPWEGKGALSTLEFFEETYSGLVATSAGPRYFGFVTGGSTPASVAGDWLVSTYDQNACGSNDSVAPQLERQTIHYFRQLFGLAPDFYGSFVTGATMANFVGLALGRQWLGEQSGIDPASEGIGNLTIKIVSGTPHSSVLKSLAMLGIGRQAVHKIETLPHREAVDLQKLESFLADQSLPVIVVANAGTVNTGDFDDLVAIGQLKKKYKFWLHVDAAFGGFAACSDQHAYLMDGINTADSLTVDAHKWLNVPYDSAMQFTTRPDLQVKVFQNSASYLSDPAMSPDFFHYTPENSRRWRALPAWFTLRSYGRKGYREIVERNCNLAVQFGARVEQSEEFLLLAPVRLNIVCFTLNEQDVNFERVQTFLKAVSDDGKVFFTPTSYKGIPAIRAAISNWQTDERDIEIAFEAIVRVWNHLELSGTFGLSAR